jgi:hypothetical protein
MPITGGWVTKKRDNVIKFALKCAFWAFGHDSLLFLQLIIRLVAE